MSFGNTKIPTLLWCGVACLVCSREMSIGIVRPAIHLPFLRSNPSSNLNTIPNQKWLLPCVPSGSGSGLTPLLRCSSSNNSSLSSLVPLEAVLFDIDGTLCDSDPLHYFAFRQMLQEIGFNGGVPITEEYFVNNIAGKHNEDIADLLFPDDHERGIKFLVDKEAMFRKFAKEQVKEAIDGLYKVKKWVEDRGLKRAAVTNAPRPNAELLLSILGLSDFFHAVILGDECDRAKPSPDAYLKALEVLNVSKDHTFVFEDSVSGIKAGVAAGMSVIGLTTRNPEYLLMEAKPAFLIKDYKDPKLWAALEEIDRKSSESNIGA